MSSPKHPEGASSTRMKRNRSASCRQPEFLGNRLQSAALPPHRHHPSETPRGLQSPEVTEPCGRGAGGEPPPAGGLRPSRRPHADAPVSRGAAATSAYRAQKGRIGRCVDKNNLINFLTDRRRQNFSKQENLNTPALGSGR